MARLTTWSGNTDTGGSYPVKVPSFVHSLVFTNKTADTATLNLTVSSLANSTEINLCPKDLQLASGESYVDNSKVFMLGDTIKFTVNKSCDFHFSIEER